MKHEEMGDAALDLPLGVSVRRTVFFDSSSLAKSGREEKHGFTSFVEPGSGPSSGVAHRSVLPKKCVNSSRLMIRTRISRKKLIYLHHQIRSTNKKTGNKTIRSAMVGFSKRAGGY